MNRRDFVNTSAALGASAALTQAQPAGKRLPIRKGMLLSMLPRTLSLTERFQLAKDCGFQSMECGTEDNPKVAEEIKAASEKAGLPIHSVMNRDHWQSPLSSPNPEVVDKSVKGMITSLDNAQLWGAGVVLLVPAVVNAEVSYGDAWKRSFDVISKRLVPEAARRKVIIGIEEVWNKFLLSPLEMANYVDSFKSPWVKAYFDVGNMVLYGFPQDWIRTLGSRIVKVHLKDFGWKNYTFTPDGQSKPVRKRVPEFVNLRDGDSGGDAEYLKDLSRRVDLILEGA
ncbi:MAG: sugar phosphate isomerase/epimerase [Acidobacteria bacterium]|nr:sugar phosphate isomerase/epimerase [Acidobacteriota bacterium]